MRSRRYSNFACRDAVPTRRRVAQVQRSENPDAGRYLDRPRPDLKARMRSGSINVIGITFGVFTLPGDFLSYLRRLPSRNAGGQALSTVHSSQSFTPKRGLKPTHWNLPIWSTEGRTSTPAAGGWFHRA